MFKSIFLSMGFLPHRILPAFGINNYPFLVGFQGLSLTSCLCGSTKAMLAGILHCIPLSLSGKQCKQGPVYGFLQTCSLGNIPNPLNAAMLRLFYFPISPRQYHNKNVTTHTSNINNYVIRVVFFGSSAYNKYVIMKH